MQRSGHILTGILLAAAGLAAAEPTPTPVIPGTPDPSVSPAPAPPPKPAPPAQPETGDGGGGYPHASFRVTPLGTGGEAIWVFEPAGPAPEKPEPVVLFIHGWAAMDPTPYGGWIRHLVRKGNVVLYPRYQEKLTTMPAAFTPALLASMRTAVDHLRKADPPRADPGRLVAAGHSMGGVLAAQYAALAAQENLPVPKALFILEPGSGEEWNPRLAFPFADLAAIPAKTLALVAVGDKDQVVGTKTARRLWKGLAHLPAANRSYLVFQSDDHGAPALVADHFFPLAPDGRILTPEAAPPAGVGRWGYDALDWRGAWRLLDALSRAAFTGEGREQCLGGTDAQKDLGRWSDGVPVRPPLVTNDP
jgi:dienelactone hydrolase